MLKYWMHDYARFSAQVFFHTKNKLKTRITNLGFLAGCFTSICEPKREKDLVLLLKAILLGFMQKQFFELLMKAASDYGALTAAVTDFQWSQNFKEPPSVWGVGLKMHFDIYICTIKSVTFCLSYVMLFSFSLHRRCSVQFQLH